MNLRHAYLALHQNINPASTELPATADDSVLPSLSSYPRCNVPSHHQHPASHAQDVVADAICHTLHPLQPLTVSFNNTCYITTERLPDLGRIANQPSCIS